MILKKKKYFIKKLELLYIRAFNFLYYLNEIKIIRLLLLLIIFIKNILSKEIIFNIYSLGIFFNYNNIKRKLEKLIMICFFYFFLFQIEYNFLFY